MSIMPGRTAVCDLNLLAAPVDGSATVSSNPLNFTSAPSRTVYLGNIAPEVTLRELLDHVQSGVVEDARLFPAKSCAFVSFVDENSALLFHSDAILNRLRIGDRDVKIGWATATLMDPLVATRIQSEGATRNVYLGNLPDGVSRYELTKDLSVYGEIDSVKLLSSKGVAFVHMASIGQAIHAVANLQRDNKIYSDRRVSFGKDRCAYVTKLQQSRAAQFLGLPEEDAVRMEQLRDRDFVSNVLLQQAAATAAIATSAGGPNNLGNRTIYVGNLSARCRIEEVCNVVRGGLLQSVKFLPDRHVCFVTFADPTAAAQFYAMASLHGLTIQRRRCKIGWGKHSGPLPAHLADAISHGASRNVYFGNVNWQDPAVAEFFEERHLRQAMSHFGEMEQVNAVPERRCVFVNFTNLESAIAAVEQVKKWPQFQQLKVNYGKDRCGNVPVES
ncbi:Mrn1p KNAG_0M00430 [Huiozyma naganishii CBS 8797]|uniref:RRM domain-containing protein n=1 Tax=Huiozyma naganishii (strain ATCC MYA-139 / BCRC 22969 / CBS 8797 / KCTC 17520 / NBRC 10181 / NCYC 3082 / Yp74L-3) TaxID=1071383 RepID=J7SBA7_HUIN7|nr:hypothetical protein KNAG_0M00430 [Kazachstania naganishii CBS 8797]CCK72896.1 hypothetical protein KNAG_0M00430 [Kazachstania naganishii CBS 8797]